MFQGLQRNRHIKLLMPTLGAAVIPCVIPRSAFMRELFVTV